MLVHAAREAGDIGRDRREEIAGLRQMLRKDYLLVGLVTFWTLFVIAFYVAGISDLITFVSNLLLCVWLHILIWNDVRRRRMVRELESSAMQDLIAKVEGKLAKMESFFAGLRRRMMEDDDDDEY